MRAWWSRYRTDVLWYVLMILLGTFAFQPAKAATPPPAQIPIVTTVYRLHVERAAASQFGLDGPVSRLAAQVHQESGWRADARSAYAEGIAQFTPATAVWLPTVCPEIGPVDTWDPDWSLRAMACYDAWLYRRQAPLASEVMSDCSRWAFTLRAYNGGEGMLRRERQRAATAGASPSDWQQVQTYRVRATWAYRENTEYPRQILLRLEPAYRAAGWPGGPLC